MNNLPDSCPCTTRCSSRRSELKATSLSRGTTGATPQPTDPSWSTPVRCCTTRGTRTHPSGPWPGSRPGPTPGTKAMQDQTRYTLVSYVALASRVSVIFTDQSPYNFWHPFVPLIDIPKGFSSKMTLEVA